MNQSTDLYDYATAAKMLHISIYTLRRWVSERKIKHLKIGSRVFFTPAILDEFLQKSIVSPINI